MVGYDDPAGLAAEVDALARRESFTGVVRVDLGEDTLVSAAYGMADRAWEMPNRPDTRFGMASGSKTFTALAVASLISDGLLSLDTPVRSILGSDLPLVDDRVTVEHLLGHTSGIGEYLDEEADWSPADHVLPQPVHTYRVSEDFVATLDGHAQRAEPGSEYLYCNGGYVVLAIVLERLLGQPLPLIVASRVFEPAGMRDTAFLETDALPGNVARGYVSDGLRSNVLILPVVATGDGGVHTTAADLLSFWRSLHDGRIVSREWVARMTEPRNWEPEESLHYGLGFYAKPPASVMLGMDAGSSFYSFHDPARDLTFSVLGNTSYAVWPLADVLLAAAS